MRGEDGIPEFHEAIELGSPPHARGRPYLVEARFGWVRITPACAGKTGFPACGHSRHGDHPRMRGEDPRSRKNLPTFTGSPPHARGRLRPSASEK